MLVSFFQLRFEVELRQLLMRAHHRLLEPVLDGQRSPVVPVPTLILRWLVLGEPLLKHGRHVGLELVDRPVESSLKVFTDPVHRLHLVLALLKVARNDSLEYVGFRVIFDNPKRVPTKIEPLRTVCQAGGLRRSFMAFDQHLSVERVKV